MMNVSDAHKQASIANLVVANEANRRIFAARPKTYFTCVNCGTQVLTRPSHKDKQFYCSTQCMATGYSARMRGTSNPNWKNAGIKTCQNCNCEFRNYNKKRKFCSIPCRDAYGRSHPKAPCLVPVHRVSRTERIRVKVIAPLPPCARCNNAPRHSKDSKYCVSVDCRYAVRRETWKRKKDSPKPDNRPIKTCLQCSAEFRAYPSTDRRYCSYQCFLDSGGPFRAGIEAAKMKRQYGHKQDANHREIIDAMRRVGCAVYDLSNAGHGVPDGIAWSAEQWRLFEIKNLKTGYGRRGLNPIQKKWLAQWKGGPIYVLHNVDEALMFAQGKLESVKCVTPEDCARQLAQALRNEPQDATPKRN